MVLPVDTVVDVKMVHSEAFHNKIPYRGIYFNTFMDYILDLSPGWLTLASSSPAVKIFTDSDAMKEKVKQTARAEQMTVETLLELSDRIDDVEQKVTELQKTAITKASDFVDKASTFWFQENSVDPLELTFPSYSIIRYKSNLAEDRTADIVMKMKNQLWEITSPVMNVAQINDNELLPIALMSSQEHRVLGGNFVCKYRYQYYNPSTGTFTDILSYTNDQENELVNIPYPLGDHAIFNDVQIRTGHTLYLEDPVARIKIKKPNVDRKSVV